MSNNLRGAYMAFEHDRPSDWRWLERWQPNVIRLMMNGKHGDPNSVDVNRIARVHRTCPNALIVLRVWEMDDRNYEAHAEMYADPIGAAQRYHAWWRALIDRMPSVPRDRLMAGAWNEPVPVNASQASALYAASEELARLGTQDSVRYAVYVWSVGKPPKDGEAVYDWAYWRRIEPALLAGDHAVMLHEYAQKEGMYGVWTDDQGNERRDWTNLMGRHLESGLQRVPVIIGEWGIDGILFNRDRHPEYGHNGWRNFGALWGPERYADEYVAYVRECAPNVIGVCPFISDHGDRKWFSFDPEPAYGAFLARKSLCERQDHQVHIPIIIGPPAQPDPEPTAEQPVPQPTDPRTLDPRVMEAIAQVESGRRAFGQDGRLIIRLEAHILKRYVPGAWWELHFAHGTPAHTGQMWRPSPDADWRTLHTGAQADEWAAFQFAHKLFPEAACLSISMGASQVMGFNHARVGFESAQAMLDVMSGSESSHYVAMCNYMLSDPALHAAVNARDWPTIGRLYNGAASAGDKYRAAYVALWGEP